MTKQERIKKIKDLIYHSKTPHQRDRLKYLLKQAIKLN